jgi:hypothetical protein
MSNLRWLLVNMKQNVNHAKKVNSETSVMIFDLYNEHVQTCWCYKFYRLVWDKIYILKYKKTSHFIALKSRHGARNGDLTLTYQDNPSNRIKKFQKEKEINHESVYEIEQAWQPS